MKTTPYSRQTKASGPEFMEIVLTGGAEPRTLASWVGMIHQAWARRADSSLELARLMSEARSGLPYGCWGRLWKSGTLPFSRRKGDMLVVIGQELGGLDAQNSAQLPPAWNTLYYLARLGRTVVEELIRSGRIRPNLSLRNAKSLLGLTDSGPQQNQWSKLKARLARLAALIRAQSRSWSAEQRKLIGTQLLALANEISGEDKSNAARACELPSALFSSLSRPLLPETPALIFTEAGLLSRTQ